MIKNRQKKTEEIIYTIENRIHEINKRYRKGPDLYFYKIEYFYGNTNESENKFFETTEFSFDLIKKLLDDNVRLDEGWKSIEMERLNVGHEYIG